MIKFCISLDKELLEEYKRVLEPLGAKISTRIRTLIKKDILTLKK